MDHLRGTNRNVSITGGINLTFSLDHLIGPAHALGISQEHSYPPPYVDPPHGVCNYNFSHPPHAL